MKTTAWDGKTITKPGLYSGLGMQFYHAPNICDGPSLSSSLLRTIINKSPAHFFSTWCGNPHAIEQEDKKHFIVGRAVHHLLLGEKFFATLFAQQPDEYVNRTSGEVKPWNNNANYCRAWHEERRKEGRSVLTRGDIDRIRGMAHALSRHPIIRPPHGGGGALNGAIERSVFWKDKATGLWLKIRPDAIPSDSGDFVDLKTTLSVQWDDLVRTIGQFGYHQQGALIRRGAREVLGIDRPTFTLVFVESSPPHCTRIVTLKDSDLDRGDRQNRNAIDTFDRCLKSGAWPGPGGEREDAEFIELSDRQQKAIDQRLTMEN